MLERKTRSYSPGFCQQSQQDLYVCETKPRTTNLPSRPQHPATVGRFLFVQQYNTASTCYITRASSGLSFLSESKSHNHRQRTLSNKQIKKYFFFFEAFLSLSLTAQWRKPTGKQVGWHRKWIQVLTVRFMGHLPNQVTFFHEAKTIGLRFAWFESVLSVILLFRLEPTSFPPPLYTLHHHQCLDSRGSGPKSYHCLDFIRPRRVIGV